MKKILLVATCIICALAVAGPVNSAPLDLTYEIGTVLPGSPASPADELVYVNNLVGLYNSGITAPTVIGAYTYDVNAGTNVPPPVLPTASGGVQDVSGNLSFVLSTPYDYLLAKYGNQDAIYWLGGFTGTVDLVSPFPAQGGGLSHITLFNPGTQVPEGNTLMLLGFGLAGVGMLRRFMKR